MKIVLHDEVHDTGHGVGAVGGRCAAGQHFDALNQLSRNQIDIRRGRIDTTGRRTGRQAAAIHQHQCALGAEIAQLQRGDTGGLNGLTRRLVQRNRRYGRESVLYAGETGEPKLLVAALCGVFVTRGKL